MDFKNIIFKIVNNAPSILRGLWFSIRIITLKNVIIGNKFRKARSVDFRFYPNSYVSVGDNVKVDKYTDIAVLGHANLKIGSNVGIGKGNTIVCHNSVTIGNNTILGPNVSIFDHNHNFSMNIGVDRRNYNSAPIYIGENCWLGAGVIVLKGVSIGQNTLIGAGSVVVKDIPGNCIAIGNPCHPIKFK